MSDTKPTYDQPLTIREHLDPEKHWIGETLAPPTQSEIAGTIGTTSGPGESPFVARADHTHKLDAGLYPVGWAANPSSPVDATTSATFGTWLTSTTVIEVPTWAVSCIIQVNINSVFSVTTVVTYGFTAVLASASFGVADHGSMATAAVNEREAVSFTADCTGFTAGSRTVIIGARRALGSGNLRADSVSKISGFVIFRASA